MGTFVSQKIRHIKRYFQEGTLSFFKSSLIEEAIKNRSLLMLNIEPTNDCNLSCMVCPRKKSKRIVGYMDFGLFKKVIDDIKKIGSVVILNFHKDGESLLHPQIIDMIRYAKHSGVAEIIHMNTNALLLDLDMSKRLLDSGIDDITFSIDANTRETFRRLKGKDMLLQVENNIKSFVDLRRSLGLDKPFVRSKIMEFELNREEVGSFMEKWKTIVDEVQITEVHDWSEAIRNVVTVKNPLDRFPCIFLRYSLAINWDGSVSLCCVDWDCETFAGNVKDSSLKEIWLGNIMKGYRRTHIEGNFEKIPLCDKCKIWSSGEGMKEVFKQYKEYYL